MSKLIAIDASPNSSSEDISLAVKLLFSLFSWGNDKYNKQLVKYFQDVYHPEVSLITKSGRAALYLLLSSVIKSKDEVITQAFTCLAVPNAILWANGKPIFADIEKDTYNIDPKDLIKKITKKTRAVIVQHTFGIPARIKEIKAICKKHDILLLEDCAHSLGTRVDSKLVGTFGDGAIFSFNQDKIVSGVNGGALLINNPALAKSFSDKQFKLNKPSIGETYRALLHPILWGIATPIYETLSMGKALVFIAWKLGILKNTITPSEEKGKMPEGLLEDLSEPQLQLILQGLQRLEKDNKRRREIAKRYKKELTNLVIHPTESKLAEPVYLRYPIQVDNPQKLLIAARKKGIILGRWYLTPIFPDATVVKDYYKIGQCPVAQRVGEHVINLPTYPRLTDDEVDQIIKVVKKAYGNN